MAKENSSIYQPRLWVSNKLVNLKCQVAGPRVIAAGGNRPITLSLDYVTMGGRRVWPLVLKDETDVFSTSLTEDGSDGMLNIRPAQQNSSIIHIYRSGDRSMPATWNVNPGPNTRLGGHVLGLNVYDVDGFPIISGKFPIIVSNSPPTSSVIYI